MTRTRSSFHPLAQAGSILLATFTLATAILPAVRAQGAPAPPRRAHHALVYDEVRERVLLAGGSTPLDGGQRYRFFNDLWEFDGRAWRALAASGPELSGLRLAFDPASRRVLSYGGFSGSASIPDLRALDGATWQVLATDSALAAAEPGFVVDRARARLIAFGGWARGTEAQSATWEHDGQRWRRLDVTSPPARQDLTMTYDERRGRTVVFGGMGVAPRGVRPPLFGDTWEFDGRAWTEVRVPGPSARVGASSAYDARRGLVLVYGGSAADTFLGDLWAFDGTSWRQLADGGPAPRAMGKLAYDRRRDRVVLFGGRSGFPDGDLDDTWEWDGTRWTRVP